MTTADNSPLSRAILAATDRKRAPFVYDETLQATPIQQHDAAVIETLLEALKVPAREAGMLALVLAQPEDLPDLAALARQAFDQALTR